MNILLQSTGSSPYVLVHLVGPLAATAAVLNMIRFQDRDPTGFCNSEPDPDWTGFRKNSTGSDVDIQTAFITAV